MNIINDPFNFLYLELRNRVNYWFQNIKDIIAHMNEEKCLKQNELLNFNVFFSDCSIWHQHLGHWYMLDTNYRSFNDSRVR